MQSQEEAEKLSFYMVLKKLNDFFNSRIKILIFIEFNFNWILIFKLEICKRLGLKAGVFLTRHDHPLGYCVGNQIEIEETVECLHGNIAPDLDELITKYGGYLLLQLNMVSSLEEGQCLIRQKLNNGEALQKFKHMLIGQGVAENIADELCKRNYDLVFQQAKFTSSIVADQSG